MAWLDTEHPILLAAQHTATRHAWHHVVWQLAWTLDTFHYWRGHRHDRLGVWRAALDAAKQLPDATPCINTHQRLGHTYAALGHAEPGIKHLQQALALDEQAHTHRTLAWSWEKQGDDRQALEHAVRARELFHALDQPVWEAVALNAMGWLAAQLGEYDTARTYCQAALALHRHHHNPGEAATLDSLGYIAHHAGDHQQAITYYQQALTLRRAFGNASEAVNTLDRLGHPHVALGQHERAHGVWREALQLYQYQGRDADAARIREQIDRLDGGSGLAR
jgi:tetratricopeptide (TPR) repeat protein